MTTSMQATVHLQDTVCHASCRPLSSIEPVFQSHITNSDPLFVLITTGEDVEVNENQQVKDRNQAKKVEVPGTLAI